MVSLRAKIAMGTVAGVALTVALLVSAMLRQARVSCEVCVTFHGAARCQTALGPDRAEAIKTATDNACGFLASGMADSISCGRTRPDRVTCDD
jgi:hypothetical protein